MESAEGHRKSKRRSSARFHDEEAGEETAKQRHDQTSKRSKTGKGKSGCSDGPGWVGGWGYSRGLLRGESVANAT